MPFSSGGYGQSDMRALYRSLSSSHPTQMRIVRFLISGSSAAGINLGTLFVLTHFFDVWYLLSSVVAFSVSFFVSFTLQKFWTFNDASLPARLPGRVLGTKFGVKNQNEDNQPDHPKRIATRVPL